MTRLEKLNQKEKKDNVVTFEELGVDHLYVDEAQDVYKRQVQDQAAFINMGLPDILDYEKMKDKLQVRICDREWNEERLAEIGRAHV